ncbi:MAG: hypothetical protein ACM3SV_10560, partial [Betaproteobacteria bacterium]
MMALLRGLFVLPLAALAWVGALWYGFAPNFSSWSWPSLLGVHVLPPLALVGAAWAYLRSRRNRAQSEAAAREQAAAAGAEAARETARLQHEAELARQRFACDCRRLAIAQISRDEGVLPEFGLDDVPVILSELPPDIEREEGIDILEHHRPAIREALESLYAAVAGAARLPIYLVPPAEAVGEALFALIREEHRALAEDLGLSPGEPPALYFLSTGDSIANCVLDLFANAPELPGAVVLGFDSPWLKAPEDDDDAPPNPMIKWLGKPGQGTFALLLTNARLPEMVEALHQALPADAEADAMMPYWERQFGPGGENSLLFSMTLDERESLAAAPLLGRIHRAHGAALGGLKSRDAIAALLPPLEKSRISAGLLDSPFVAADNTPAPGEAAPECGWLVHNAGGVDCSGNRLATLGMALYQQGLEVDPIHAGSNLVVQTGDLGQARSLGLLAMAVARATANQAAALVAEFTTEEHVALYFVVA